jgi:hypothetical protein
MLSICTQDISVVLGGEKKLQPFCLYQVKGVLEVHVLLQTPICFLQNVSMQQQLQKVISQAILATCSIKGHHRTVNQVKNWLNQNFSCVQHMAGTVITLGSFSAKLF